MVKEKTSPWPMFPEIEDAQSPFAAKAEPSPTLVPQCRGSILHLLVK